MNGLNFLIQPAYYLEIGQDFVKAQGVAGGFELGIERQPNGRLTPVSKEKLTLNLQAFLKRKAWQPRSRVVCAISARGVTLRRLTLPAATKENLQKLLRLQIESEFPLSPDELAWGYRPVSETTSSPDRFAAAAEQSNSNGKTGHQDLLVVAVKREVVEEYSEILSACAANAVFTLAALARSRLCPQTSGTYTMLDIGPTQSELTSFANGIPSSVRVVPWGSHVLTRAFEGILGVSREEAERLSSSREPIQDGVVGEKIKSAVESALEPLAAAMNGSVTKLYLTGACVRPLELAPRLSARVGQGLDCLPLDVGDGQGQSATIVGLKKATEQNATTPLLLLQVKTTNGTSRLPRSIAWKSAKPALALVLALLCLPYAEALLLKPFLSSKLTALKANKGRLLAIDRELGFLQYLKENQSPYLDAMFLISKVAPPGAHIDSLSMNRHGDLSLKISMRQPTEAVDFRSKLVDSGFFSNVAVEEQAPSADRQKLSVRLSAQWKAAGVLQALAIGPTPEEIEKARTNKNRTMGAPPMMSMPMPMPGPGPGPIGGPGLPGSRIESGQGKGPPPGTRRGTVRPTDIPPPTNVPLEGGPR